MSMKYEQFGARLVNRLEAADSYLPLSNEATADLLNLLTESDDYIYLSIGDEKTYEIVKCRAEGGLLIIERGLEGTSAVLHGYGACVSSVSPLIIAIVKDLICNYSCCEDGDCECEPVAFGMSFLPYAKQGAAWEGMATFSGNTPMNIGVNGAPDWMQVDVEGTTIRFSGTPNVVGPVSFSVAASNCGGTSIVSHVISFNVEANV